MSHLIYDPVVGWRILIAGGKILNTPPFPRLGESVMVVEVEKPVKQFFKELLKHGFAHHAIVVYGDVKDYLEVFAERRMIGEFTREVVKVTEAEFTYVAIDDHGQPRPVLSE